MGGVRVRVRASSVAVSGDQNLLVRLGRREFEVRGEEGEEEGEEDEEERRKKKEEKKKSTREWGSGCSCRPHICIYGWSIGQIGR